MWPFKKVTTSKIVKTTEKLSSKLDCVEHQICPDCETEGQILEGPRGGMCVNVMCGNCKSRFNITPCGVERI